MPTTLLGGEERAEGKECATVILQENALASMTYPTDRQLDIYLKAGARRMAFR
jgi:hypothetical protein